LFADVLSSGQLNELARGCKLCFFARGSVLMHQGDFGSSMFGILNGQASVTFVDDRAYGNTVAVLSPGEVAGGNGNADGRPPKRDSVGRHGC
jgi:CRP-like cAMP-binding protein